MSANTSPKVIELTSRKELSHQQNHPGISKNISSHVASIHAIGSQSTGNIYWWRDRNPESGARDFFETFVETRKVAFLYNEGNPSHIMRIRTHDTWGYPYEISAEQFIYLTALDMDSIKDTEKYITMWFNQMNSEPVMRYKERIEITRFTLTEAMIPLFYPEDIAAFKVETGDSYTCELYNHFWLIGYGLVDDYQNANVLDLMVAAFSKAELTGLPIENSRMEVCLIEEWETIITEIWTEILEQVIHTALQRLDGKYGKMDSAEARKYYFKCEVIPKII